MVYLYVRAWAVSLTDFYQCHIRACDWFVKVGQLEERLKRTVAIDSFSHIAERKSKQTLCFHRSENSIRGKSLVQPSQDFWIRFGVARLSPDGGELRVVVAQLGLRRRCRGYRSKTFPSSALLYTHMHIHVIHTKSMICYVTVVDSCADEGGRRVLSFLTQVVRINRHLLPFLPSFIPRCVIQDIVARFFFLFTFVVSIQHLPTCFTLFINKIHGGWTTGIM